MNGLAQLRVVKGSPERESGFHERVEDRVLYFSYLISPCEQFILLPDKLERQIWLRFRRFVFRMANLPTEIATWAPLQVEPYLEVRNLHPGALNRSQTRIFEVAMSFPVGNRLSSD